MLLASPGQITKGPRPRTSAPPSTRLLPSPTPPKHVCLPQGGLLKGTWSSGEVTRHWQTSSTLPSLTSRRLSSLPSQFLRPPPSTKPQPSAQMSNGPNSALMQSPLAKPPSKEHIHLMRPIRPSPLRTPPMPHLQSPRNHPGSATPPATATAPSPHSRSPSKTLMAQAPKPFFANGLCTPSGTSSPLSDGNKPLPNAPLPPPISSFAQH